MRAGRTRTHRTVTAAMTVVATVAVVIAGAGPAEPGRAAAAPRALEYDFSVGIRAETANPGGSLPGTNDFRCRPSRVHPRPVMLVHGYGGGRQTNWGTLAAVLVRAGYCVFAPTYGALAPAWPVSAIGGVGPKVDSAWEIKAFAERVLAATGTRSLDVVGHSLGTEIPTYWLKYLGGQGLVAHYVSLAPYWRQGPDGDDARSDAVADFRRLLGVPPPVRPDCPECTPAPRDASFNAAVRRPTPYLPGIAYTNIVTRHDQIVTPYDVGVLDGPPGTSVRNVVVQDGCRLDRSDHMAITSSRRAAALVLNALDPERRLPVPCDSVRPFLG